jgi:hypothetical protein
VAGDRLWLTGQVAGRETVLVEIDLATMAIASRTIINGGARAIAVAGSSVWIGVVNGTLLRFGT